MGLDRWLDCLRQLDHRLHGGHRLHFWYIWFLEFSRVCSTNFHIDKTIALQGNNWLCLNLNLALCLCLSSQTRTPYLDHRRGYHWLDLWLFSLFEKALLSRLTMTQRRFDVDQAWARRSIIADYRLFVVFVTDTRWHLQVNHRCGTWLRVGGHGRLDCQRLLWKTLRLLQRLHWLLNCDLRLLLSWRLRLLRCLDAAKLKHDSCRLALILLLLRHLLCYVLFIVLSDVLRTIN